VRVKLSVCLISSAPCPTYRGEVFPPFLTSSLDEVMSFTSWQLHPQYLFDTRLCGPQSSSGRCGKKETNSCRSRESNSARRQSTYRVFYINLYNIKADKAGTRGNGQIIDVDHGARSGPIGTVDRERLFSAS
jgi:hypothetical protein